MTDYPNPQTLRAEAEKLERDAEAISDASEYPRVARFTVRGQVEALRNFADTIEAEGDVPAKRPGMSGEERRERRAAILRLRAARLKVKANDAHRRSHDIGSRIPFGQPILVGHHSERGHRRDIDRMHRATGEAIAADNYAEELDRRADHVERSHAIFQSDSDAVEQYERKLETLTRERDHMKAVNAAWRRFDKSKDDPAELHSLGVQDIDHLQCKIAAAYSWEKQPFPKWQISNLGAVIRDTEKKLERARVRATTPETSREADGIRLEDSPQDNRVRLFFPGKPADDVRAKLKRSGFRWSPSLGCWQAFRNWRAQQVAAEFVGCHLCNDPALVGKRSGWCSVCGKELV